MAHVYDMDCELGCRLLRAEKDKIKAVKDHAHEFGWVTYDEITKILEDPE